MFVTLEPREDHLIRLETPVAQLEVPLDAIQVQPPLAYVLQTLKASKPARGLYIAITLDISPTMGLGTSAAAVVALLGALGVLEKR